MHPILLTYSFGPPWPWPGMAWGKSRALCFPSMDVGQPAGYVGQYVSPLWGSRYRYWGSGQPTIYIIFRVKWGLNFQSLTQVQVKRYEVGKKYKTIHRKQTTSNLHIVFPAGWTTIAMLVNSRCREKKDEELEYCKKEKVKSRNWWPNISSKI